MQLEVTSRCTASCTYCPRTAAGASWRGRDLPLELLNRLIPDLARTRYVHLQGWGEPLLHPRFFEVLERLRAAGRRVGTTSNGLLLDRACARALVKAGAGVVALSVAGADAVANDPVRRGVPLERVITAARTLREERGGREVPRIHLAYLLLRSGLSSIDRLPDLVEAAGVDEVVVSSLSLVTCRELLTEAVLASDAAGVEAVRGQLLEVDREVQRRGVRIHWQLLSPFVEPGGCPENAERSVFIGADGHVYPCVLNGVPVDGTLDSFVWSGIEQRRCFAYDELRSAGLAAVWHGPASRSFRRRLATANRPAECAQCLKRWRIPLEARVDLVPVV